MRDLQRPCAEVAFVVDEAYQGAGIATFMFKMLVRLARERGLKGFKAEVLSSNKSMLKVFEKGGLPVEARVAEGIYEVNIPFE